MAKKIILDEKELYQKYIIECLSKKNTALYFGVSVDTISANLKDYNIPSHKLSDFANKQKITLNDTQYNFLRGSLLGDGCLYMKKNGINAQFIYTSKSLQHVTFVEKHFSDMLYKEDIKHISYFDKRTNKEYERYTFRTISDQVFTKEYHKWYKNGIKHIPYDLKLNPTICLMWYIGDGSISHNKKTCYIKLSTNCFEKTEQENILLPQLSSFEAKLVKGDVGKNGKQQYFIYIPRRKAQDFLNYIGNCPFTDYSYKWDLPNYKNTYMPNYPEKINQMIELFKKGNSAGTIARILKVDRSTIVKYLLKNGYDPKKNIYKKGSD